MIQARSVSQLLGQLRTRLSRDFRQVWVRAEVAQLSASPQGHLYFTLKDRQALITAVVWSKQRQLLDFAPTEGMNVLAQGSLVVYSPRGQLQFVVEQLIPDGVGQYFVALEQLKQKLLQEGLFEVGRKRPLPFLPRRVGVVTSPEGAVWHDIRTTLERRNPSVQLVLSPSPVQGPQATGRLIRALTLLTRANVEVVILARGGGSWEDLIAFNSEPLVRFLATYPLPVIAAIGHETDLSLVDQVADRRAPTPTAAAELVAPERDQLLRELNMLQARLRQALLQRTQRQREVLDALSQRPCFQEPQRLWEEPRRLQEKLEQALREALRARASLERQRWQALQAQLQPVQLQGMVQLQREQLRNLEANLRAALPRTIETKRTELHEQRQMLQTLSPQRVLERGYALCLDDRGQLVTSVAGRKDHDQLEIRLADGRMQCVVEQVFSQSEDRSRD
ncbi:MAG: exodeoxyribonuclease VII large subunit [Candidatus Eremiobacteraeota bacterium]|nr:exodeoxyribonuclease VII large subunit [Candidatus Eremiobacteraeota bacterium]MCW5867717.1 exodeoxyribonuclease VII large subunit [Candidatus Eremiobacteraeota bacterium]